MAAGAFVQRRDGKEMTDEEIARAEAEGIAKRWVPGHMTARQGLVDDIVASLLNARRLERDKVDDQVERLISAVEQNTFWTIRAARGKDSAGNWR